MTTIGVFAAVFDGGGRVLCVRQNYADHVWTMPGGRMEAGEDPVSGAEREALEEAAVKIAITALVGVYSAVYSDDLVLMFEARLVQQLEWAPNEEISEIGFFALDDLPEPMSANARLRFGDVRAKRRGLLRTLSAPGMASQERCLG